MESAPAQSHPREARLIESAQAGDRDAFEELIEPHRSALRAHCYRMLGSIHDADDAQQDALLRAWRGLAGFDGRASLRSWLFRVATNATLDASSRRRRHRVLPFDEAAASGRPEAVGEEPREEAVPWLEPFPGPHDELEQRETVELAFVAALQHLAPNQRATLILRDVLDFSAQETAEALGTSVASVTSALQRARETARDRLPERSQQSILAEVGDERVRASVSRYVEAMDRGDVDGVVALLSQDATWSMPPLMSWYTGHDAIATFLRSGPMRLSWRRPDAGMANGQPASAAYLLDEAAGVYRPYALDVFSFDGPQISSITAFLEPDLMPAFGLPAELPAAG